MAEQTAWCLGVAESGRRELTNGERTVLEAHLAQARSALKLWRWGWLSFWIAAALLYPLCHDALAAGSAKKAAVPLLYVVLASFPAAALMALTEVITGRSRTLRWSFAALGLGSIALALGVVPLGTIGLLGIYLGGTGCWVVRWQLFRRLRALLPLLEADLRDGDVAEFQVNPEAGTTPPKTLARAKVRFDGEPVRFAILPRSGVLVSVGGTFVDTFLAFDRSWDPLDATLTVRETGYHAPIPNAPAALRDMLGQRHVTSAELAEIAVHRKRLLRRSIGSFFVTTYFSAFGIRFVEAVIEGRMKTGVSPLGWTIALAIGVYAAWRSIRPRLALGRAAAAAQVVLVRNDEPAPGEPKEHELLMGSGLLWTVDGKPAPWRTVKW